MRATVLKQLASNRILCDCEGIVTPALWLGGTPAHEGDEAEVRFENPGIPVVIAIRKPGFGQKYGIRAFKEAAPAGLKIAESTREVMVCGEGCTPSEAYEAMCALAQRIGANTVLELKMQAVSRTRFNRGVLYRFMGWPAVSAAAEGAPEGHLHIEIVRARSGSPNRALAVRLRTCMMAGLLAGIPAIVAYSTAKSETGMGLFICLLGVVFTAVSCFRLFPRQRRSFLLRGNHTLTV